MDIAERLKKLIELLDFTPASFADEIKVQRSGISHILSGRNKPSLEFIQKMIRRFPETDLHWLITGQKSKLISTEEKSSASTEMHIDAVDLSMKVKEGKKIVKIVLLYNDHTFDEFRPPVL